MALTYRTPMEDIVNCFEPATQAVIANSAATLYKNFEEQHCQYFNYYLSPLAKRKLSMAGIYLSPYSAVVHSHPVCKTLENYILYSVLPSYINSSFYFVGIKERKLQLLKSKCKNLDSVQVVNRYVTSADRMRYTNDFVPYGSYEHECLVHKGVGLDNETLRGLVGPLRRHKAKNLFLHDELHYWSSKVLIDFLDVMRPDKLLGTVVYPPELLFKQTRSLNEWCYTYDIVGDTLMFFPDGVQSEGYQQPLKGGYLLGARSLKLPDGTVYMVDVLCSKFAHHLISITKGEAAAPTHRAFGPFEAVASEALTALSPDYPVCFPVSYEVVNKIYRYLRTLKKPDEQSAIAKLSQIIAEPSGREIDFVECFARLVIHNSSMCATIMPEQLKEFMGNWLGRMPSVLARRFSSVRAVCVNKFIRGLKPYSFTLRLNEITWWNIWNNSYTWFFDTDAEVDVPEKLDTLFMGEGACLAAHTTSRPYVGTVPLADREWNALLSMDLQKLLHAMRRMFMRGAWGAHMRVISRGYLLKYVEARLKSSCLIAKARRRGQHKERLEVWEVLGLKSSDALFRAMTYLCNARLEPMFSESGLRWFLTRGRNNLYSLTNYTEGKRAVTGVQNLWSNVVHEVSTKRHKGMIRLEKARVTEQPRSEFSSCVLEPEVLRNVEAALEIELGEVACACNARFVQGVVLSNQAGLNVRERVAGASVGLYTKDRSNLKWGNSELLSNGWPRSLSIWMEVNSVSQEFDVAVRLSYSKETQMNVLLPNLDGIERGAGATVINLRKCGAFIVRCAEGGECAGVDGPHLLEVMGQDCIGHECYMKGLERENDVVVFLKKTTVSEQVAFESAQEVSPIESKSYSGAPGVGVNLDLGGVVCSEYPANSAERYKRVSVPGDGSCFWHSVAYLVGMHHMELKRLCTSHVFESAALNDELEQCKAPGAFVTHAAILATALRLRAEIRVHNAGTGRVHRFAPKQKNMALDLWLESEHYEPQVLRNGCVIEAVALALGRRNADILAVVEERCCEEVVESVQAGLGLNLHHVEIVLQCFDIVGHCNLGDKEVTLNAGGKMSFCFDISDEHMSFCGRRKDPSCKLVSGALHGKMFAESALLDLENCGLKIDFEPNWNRAGMLADSMHQGATGVLGSALFNNKRNMREKFVRDTALSLHAIVGTFGSGKSTLFKNLLKHGAGKSLDFVSPRRALAEDFKRTVGMNERGGRAKAGQENWRVTTLETFLARVEFLTEGQVVILDEMQLYPPGYFDLVVSMLKVDVRLFLVGDPAQSDYDSEKDRLVLGAMEENMSVILGASEYNYKVRSHRFLNCNFIGRLPCEINKDDCTIDEPHIMRMHLENLLDVAEEYKSVVLVSSFDEKMVVCAHLPEAKVLTFGESTGLTFMHGTIYISAVSERTNERRWITALSRFRFNLCFVNCSGMDYQQLAGRYKGRVLSKFLCKTAIPDDLIGMLPGKALFKSEYPRLIGKDEGVREEKLAGDPWLKTMINLYQAPDVEIAEEPEVVMQEEWFRTHLPRDELESVRAQWVHKILAKEYREVRMGDMVSEQFTDDHTKQLGAKQLTNAAERFETIYPRHRASDTVTFLMAVKKRLSFSNPGKEKGKLFHAASYGKALLSEFLKRVPLKPNHNVRFMEEALWNFEEKKLSKSAATIENHSGRSCRDWPTDVAQIFSKSQLCTKFDNRFRVAKAAQSIVCFQHAVLCRFAPYMRYIEMKVHEVLPKNYYIHSGKGLEELDAWVKKGKFDGICTESDYEAFDASQDEFIMAFELELMKYLRLPSDLIEDYKFIKTSLGSKLGNFAIMRFSGEASTFLFNTLANMLFTFMRYSIRGDEFICFAGDDMCASRRLQPTKKFAHFLDKLKLKAKVQFVNKPTFCGWHLCPDGIYKKPQLVLERMCIAKEMNNLSNCIDNYAIEVAYAYKLGEKAVNRMDEEEVAAFYNCVRIIVRNKHLIRSDVKQVFEVL
nr:MAG: polyprotein (methyl transferase, alkylated DNA repair protein, protease, helicase, RdRP) [Potato virus M]UTQ50769.1 MAG: polyprotein (methyl transferase, alkylated DNA repair protein, protease, helicase, RdRP) [Potato virus M]